jgi:hypothetical protein
VNEVPVVGKAVSTGIFAHGRNCNAVRKREAAKRERGKKMVCRLSHGY